MESALQTLIKSAAGTGGPTNPSSRYYGCPILNFARPDGVQVAYLQRRIIPQPETYASVQRYAVVDGDRLDNLSARFYGDPILYWMICDASGATDPDELTAQIGRTIQVPLAASLPSGARGG
jgi:hypothetical protein